MRECKAVFFDIDNTLYDFEESVCGTLARVRSEFPSTLGRFVDSRDLERRYWDANRSIPETERLALIERDPLAYREATWRAFLAREGVRGDAAALAAAWGRGRHDDVRAAVFPGMREAVAALGERYALGVVSNGPAAFQRDKLHALGVAPLFRDEFVVISGEFGVDKPDPAIFEEAARRAKVPPAACVMVGDSAANDLPAKRLGFRTVHFVGAAILEMKAGEIWTPDAVVANYAALRKLLL